MDEFVDLLNRVVSSADNLREQMLASTKVGNNIPKNQSGEGSEELLKTLDEFKNIIDKTNKELKTAVSNIENLNKSTKKLDKSVENTVKNAAKSIGTIGIGGGGGGGGSGGGGGGSFFGGGSDPSRNINQAHNNLKAFRGTLTAVFTEYSRFLLSGRSLGGALFGDIQEQAITFNRKIREAAFEVSGFGSESRNLQNEWADISNAVAETGQQVGEFQENYLRALRSGLGDQGKALDVTKSALNVSRLIGSSASSTSATFNTWTRSLRLSETQVAQIARDMQLVGRETGIVGDELLGVVDSSYQFMINMRNAGQSTAASARNMMMVVAEARKLGVEGTVNPILEMLTDPSKIVDGGGGARNLLLMAGGISGNIQQILDGTVMQSRSSQASLARGYEGAFQRLSGGRTIADFSATATDAEKRRMDIVLSQFDTSLGELSGTIEALNKGSASLTDRLSELALQTNNANLTTQERALSEKQYQEAIMGAGLEFATAFDEQRLKLGSTSIDQIAASAVSRMDTDRLTDAKELAKIAGISATTDRGVFEASLLAAAKSISELGGEDLTKSVTKAFASGDARQVKNVTDALTSAQRELSIDDKASADPMTQMAQNVSEIAEILRNQLSPMARAMIDLAGIGGIIAVHAGSVSTTIWKLVELLGSVGGLRGILTRVTGRGGGVAGTIGDIASGGVLVGGGSAAGSVGRGASTVASAAGSGAAMAGSAASVSQIGRSGAFFGRVSGAVAGLAGSVTSLAGSGTLLTGLAAAAPFVAKALAIGTAAIIILTPLVSGIAIAILKMSEIVTQFMSPEEASKAASGLATILLSAGKIAGAIALSAAGLAAMSLMIPLLSPMALGAVALGMFIVPVSLIATGVIKISQAVMKHLVDPKEAEEAAVGLSNILEAASSIAFSVTSSAALLAGLGVFSSVAYASIPFIVAGAAALTALSVPVVAISVATIKLTEKVMSVTPDLTAARQAAESLSGILESASSIIWSVMKISTMLGGLGLLSGLAYAAVPFIVSGAAALGVLSVPVVGLSVAINKMAELFVNSGVYQSNSAEVAEKIANTLDSAGSIAWVIVKKSVALSLLAGMATYSTLGAAAMVAGSWAIDLLGKGLLSIAKSVSSIGEGIDSTIDVDQLKRTSFKISNLIESVTKTVSVMKDKISPLTDGGFFGRSPVQKIQKSVRSFADVFSGITLLVKDGFIKPLTQISVSELEAAIVTAERVLELTERMAAIANQISFTDPTQLAGIREHVASMIAILSDIDNAQQASMTPESIGDIEDRLGSERAARAPATGSLAAIQAYNAEQVALLTRIAVATEGTYSLLTGSGERDVPVASTRAHQRPRGSADFGNWKFGKTGGQANRNIVNDGMS